MKGLRMREYPLYCIQAESDPFALLRMKNRLGQQLFVHKDHGFICAYWDSNWSMCDVLHNYLFQPMFRARTPLELSAMECFYKVASRKGFVARTSDSYASSLVVAPLTRAIFSVNRITGNEYFDIPASQVEGVHAMYRPMKSSASLYTPFLS